MLSAEISAIYRGGDRTRKVHHLLYAPTFEAADRITTALSKIGNLASDGRPILGLDSRHLAVLVARCLSPGEQLGRTFTADARSRGDHVQYRPGLLCDGRGVAHR